MYKGGTANAGIAVNWNDAHRRVLKSYREWIRSVRKTPIITYVYLKCDLN